MKMRKTIAVFAAIMMLCALLPLGAISASAYTYYVYQEDFEDGIGTWQANNGTIEAVAAADLPVANANGGAYAMKHDTGSAYPYTSDRTGITVKANTDYVLTFDALHATNNWPVQGIIGTNYWLGTVVATTGSVKIPNTAWTTLTLEFNSGSNTKVYMGLKSAWNNSVVYFDNVSIREVVAPSNDGYITNGNFECADTTGWNVGSGVAADGAAAYEGDYGLNLYTAGTWDGLANQTITTLVPGNQYYISFRYKTANGGGCNFALKDTDKDGTKYGGQWISNTADWTQYSLTFTALTNVAYLNFSGPGNTEYAGNIYVDDLRIYAITDPSDDGYVYNGTFECYDTVGWSVNGNTAASPDAAHNGGFGLALNTDGSWNSMAYQSVDGLEVGAKYTISFYYKNVGKGGGNFAMKDGNTTVSGSAVWMGDKADWTFAEKTFVATAETLKLNFSGPGNTEYAGITYVDDIGMVKYCDVHGHNYIPTVTAPDCENGGYTTYNCDGCPASYVADETEALGHNYEGVVTAPDCENGGYTTYACATCGDSYVADETAALGHTYDNEYDVDCNTCGAIREVDVPLTFGGKSVSEDVSGLAFKFTVDVTGMAVDRTTAIYDEAYVGEYKLVKMGAVVSNGKSTADVPAVYLCELDEASASFAVRVTGIPAANYDSEITAIPYIILEINGEEVTIEGDLQTGTYNGTLNG